MVKNNNKIYLDYAATTPVDKQVLEEMMPYFSENFGNPSSIHTFGQKAIRAIDDSREKVAELLNCSSSEIIFTGSATEANNLAIRGIVESHTKEMKDKPHIITSPIEHDAVLELCKKLEKERKAEVTYLSVDKEGFVSLEELKNSIQENTLLVSIIYANNEIGTIQPIDKIGKAIKEINSSRKRKVYFHTDAVQAVNYLNCNVEELGVDLLTLSGHKIYGPKGVGALYVNSGTRLKPLLSGGGQENGIRPGTHNTPAIVGLGKAIENVGKEKEIQHIQKLRDQLIEGILENIPNAKLNGPRENRLPNNANISISGAEGESLIMSLDQKGIAASTGSACSSKNLEPSHVLIALGLSPKQAHGSIRFSLGKYTTQQEIEKVIEVLPQIVERLRKISPFD